MEADRIRDILEQVKDGGMTPDQAITALKLAPYEDLGYARIDHHRGLRQGANEVIFGQNKTPEQITGIVKAMMARGEENIHTEDGKQIADVLVGDFFIVKSPVDSDKYQSLTKDLAKKYAEKFKYPERFYRQNGEIKVHQIKPKERSDER